MAKMQLIDMRSMRGCIKLTPGCMEYEEVIHVITQGIPENLHDVVFREIYALPYNDVYYCVFYKFDASRMGYFVSLSRSEIYIAHKFIWVTFDNKTSWYVNQDHTIAWLNQELTQELAKYEQCNLCRLDR